MATLITCSDCGVSFEYNSYCPSCGRDREGFTEEDRNKVRPSREVANRFLVTTTKDKAKIEKMRKKNEDRFPNVMRRIKRGKRN